MSSVLIASQGGPPAALRAGSARAGITPDVPRQHQEGGCEVPRTGFGPV
jgi:hypothetical protein